MGVRSTYTIHIDTKTDAITTAWIGPDQTNQDDHLGPGQDRERDDDELGRATGAGRSARPATAGTTASRRRTRRRRCRGAFGDAARARGGRRRRERPDRRVTSTAAARSQRLAVQHRPARRSPRRSRSTSGTARRAAATATRPTPTASASIRRCRQDHANNVAAPAIYRLCPWLGSSGARRRSTAASTASRWVTSRTRGRPTGTGAGS